MSKYTCSNCGVQLVKSISYDYRIYIENMLTHCVTSFAYIQLCDDCATHRMINKIKGED